jgi:hypothetical protein
VKGLIVALKDFYGFVRDEDGVDYFFSLKHLSDEEDKAWLKIGAEVIFSKFTCESGLRAKRVRPAQWQQFEWREGVHYLDRVSKGLMKLRTCEGIESLMGGWVMDRIDYVTDFYPSVELATREVWKTGDKLCANFASDFKIETEMRLVSGFAVKIFRCVCTLGVLVRPRKIREGDRIEDLRRKYERRMYESLWHFNDFKNRAHCQAG